MGWNASIDWTSADTIRNSPRGIVLYDLMMAVYERGIAIGGSISNDVTTKLGIFADNQAFLYYYVTPPFIYPWMYWMYWIDTYVRTTFLPHFVNQTDQSGDWDGSATAPPVWTLSDLETEIGATAPALPATGGAAFAWYITMDSEWVWWMHEALNLLVWRRTHHSGFSAQGDNLRFHYNDGQPWATVVAGFNATAWAYSGANFIGHYARYSGYAGGSYTIYRGRGAITTPDLPYTYDYDGYMYVAEYTTPFEDNDNFATENTYIKAPTNTGVSAPEDAWFGNFGDNTCSQPAAVEGEGPSWYSALSYAGAYMIYKFDVIDGFEYVA